LDESVILFLLVALVIVLIGYSGKYFSARQIEKIVVYNEGVVKEIKPDDGSFKELADAVAKFTDKRYAKVQWGDSGNAEVADNMHRNQGVLVVFKEQIELTPAYKDRCKRLYIPIDGHLMNEQTTIIMTSESEDAWDWVGFGIDPLNKERPEVKELKSILSALNII